jgi:DNA-binding transcriptional MerR regulator
MRQWFSTPDVSGLTGASVRQIDYWARTGLLRPSDQQGRGKGSRRRYAFRDVVAVQTIQKLREGNCPLQKVRTAIRYLKAHYPAGASNTEFLSRLTLLTDGQKVYLGSDEREVMEVLTRQMVWSVPIGKLILDTQERIRRMPSEWVEAVRLRGKLYHLEVARDEETGEYGVQCRELPGAIEQGRTLTEAVAAGRDAVESVLHFLSRRQSGAGARVKAL